MVQEPRELALYRSSEKFTPLCRYVVGRHGWVFPTDLINESSFSQGIGNRCDISVYREASRGKRSVEAVPGPSRPFVRNQFEDREVDVFIHVGMIPLAFRSLDRMNSPGRQKQKCPPGGPAGRPSALRQEPFQRVHPEVVHPIRPINVRGPSRRANRVRRFPVAVVSRSTLRKPP
jgi:hypothetical protein